MLIHIGEPVKRHVLNREWRGPGEREGNLNDTERETRLARLEACKAAGEKAYDDMYECSSPTGASGCYSDAKEFFSDAIRLAEELGLADEAAALHERREHIKAVFRSQFS
jgi:hypothetical protein